MKRLTLDIETAPNIGFFWRPGYDLDIGHNFIIKERAIITICYKWEGKKVEHLVWDKNQNDEKMLKEFIGILNEADEIVAHNGDRFDLPWIRGRAMKFGISVPPTLITTDTCKLARSLFNMNSNKLDYLAKYLEVGGKTDTGGFQLWKDIILNKDPKALSKMVRYCENDVIILEKVFKKMKPYIKSKISISADRRVCPECGGNMRIEKHRIKASGAKVTQLQCIECGKYNQIPTSMLNKK